MNKLEELSPNNIIERYNSKEIDKFSTFQQLIAIIENSNNINHRIESIRYLLKLGIKKEAFFELLENLLISDSNPKIRSIAVKIIKNNFIEKAFDLMNWAYNHEDSIECIVNIISTIGEIDTYESKSFLINKLRDVKSDKYKSHLKRLFKNIKLNGYSASQLATILNNYHVIKFLEKKFKKINYKIKTGVVITLDLSNASNYHVFEWNILNRLPEIICTLNFLIKLDMKFNRIKIVSSAIKNLQSLKYLDLSYNKIKNLPNSIGKLHSLTYLNLKHNNLTDVPDIMGDLVNLKTLDLRANNLRYVPKSLNKLTKLEELILHGNKLDDLTLSFNNSSLKLLELGLNNLNHIPKGFKYLNSLKRLGLGSNKIIEVPFWIRKLTSLEELHLYNNNINELPSSIGKLSNLKELTLWNNNLRTLPQTFKSLTNLKRLNLSWNKFEVIPDILPDSLEILSLWGNNLKIIHEATKNLKNLRILDLNFNKNLEITENIRKKLEKNGLTIYK